MRQKPLRNSFAYRLTAYIHKAYAASFSVPRCAYPFSPQGSVCTEPAVSLEAVGLFAFGMSGVPAALEKRRSSSVLVCCRHSGLRRDVFAPRIP